MRPATGFRMAVFMVAWLALAGWSVPDALAGLAAAAAATAISLRLAPSGARLSPGGLFRFALRFMVRSLAAGLDVARRAFDPALPLSPGFVEHTSELGPGTARDALAAVLSLQPGTLPAAATQNGFLIHGLDMTRPVAADVAEDERAFTAVFARDPRRE
jgi:multicomponent Na+:H+ antiporter subunit E